MILEHLSVCERKIVEYKGLLEKLDKNPENLFELFHVGRDGLFYLMINSSYKKNELLDYFLTYFTKYLKDNFSEYSFDKNLEIITVKYDDSEIIKIDIFDGAITSIMDAEIKMLDDERDKIISKSNEVYSNMLKLEERYSDVLHGVEKPMEIVKTAIFSKRIKKEIKKEMIKLNNELWEMDAKLEKITVQINKRKDELLHIEDKKDKMIAFLKNKFSFKINENPLT